MSSKGLSCITTIYAYDMACISPIMVAVLKPVGRRLVLPVKSSVGKSKLWYRWLSSWRTTPRLVLPAPRYAVVSKEGNNLNSMSGGSESFPFFRFLTHLTAWCQAYTKSIMMRGLCKDSCNQGSARRQGIFCRQTANNDKELSFSDD
jgi:hypothetical protein